MFARLTVLVLFVCVLGAPFLFRPAEESAPVGARQLIIVTPHNEQIRYEFAAAFDTWHRARYGEPVEIAWNVPGGTSEIRKMLFAEYQAAFESGRAPGGTADLVFGGGSYEHAQLASGVAVRVDGARRQEPVTARLAFSTEWLEQTYGVNEIGDAALFDPDGSVRMMPGGESVRDVYWFGTALSSFGIVYNRDVLRVLDVPEPTTWADLARPDLRGWVALVNPGQSGSVTTAFEAILQREGWRRGWQILRRASANARYFSATSLKPPTDVSQGEAAMGICIDFYGRFQSQAIRVSTGDDRVGYVDPPGVSTIDPDPISMLRGAPHPELARRFIEFTLDDAAQALWQFRTDDDSPDALGPRRFELRRLPIRRAFFERYAERMIDDVDPYAIASRVDHPVRAIRAFIPAMFAAMAMENHETLRHAWDAIVTHPAYPPSHDLVTSEDVEDAELRAMLEAFDAMPVIPGLDGATYELAGTEHLETVKRGWLREGWVDAGLWPPESSAQDAFRRRLSRFFHRQYEAVTP